VGSGDASVSKHLTPGQQPPESVGESTTEPAAGPASWGFAYLETKFENRKELHLHLHLLMALPLARQCGQSPIQYHLRFLEKTRKETPTCCWSWARVRGRWKYAGTPPRMAGFADAAPARESRSPVHSPHEVAGGPGPVRQGAKCRWAPSEPSFSGGVKRR
jgi:hypothetical protein